MNDSKYWLIMGFIWGAVLGLTFNFDIGSSEADIKNQLVPQERVVCTHAVSKTLLYVSDPNKYKLPNCEDLWGN